MIKQLLGGVSLCAALVLSASNASAQSAVYNPGTGDLILSLPAGISVAGFGTNVGGLEFNAAASGNWGATTPAQKDATTLAYFSATGLPAGTNTIAAILPTGLQATGGKLTQVIFSYTPSGQDTQFGDILVPEPASLALAACAMVPVVARRRRK